MERPSPLTHPSPGTLKIQLESRPFSYTRLRRAIKASETRYVSADAVEHLLDSGRLSARRGKDGVGADRVSGIYWRAW
jgi:hypothetical protein